MPARTIPRYYVGVGSRGPETAGDAWRPLRVTAAVYWFTDAVLAGDCLATALAAAALDHGFERLGRAGFTPCRSLGSTGSGAFDDLVELPDWWAVVLYRPTIAQTLGTTYSSFRRRQPAPLFVEPTVLIGGHPEAGLAFGALKAANRIPAADARAVAAHTFLMADFGRRIC